jgi:hypothetical protein
MTPDAKGGSGPCSKEQLTTCWSMISDGGTKDASTKDEGCKNLLKVELQPQADQAAAGGTIQMDWILDRIDHQLQSTEKVKWDELVSWKVPHGISVPTASTMCCLVMS